MKIAVTALASLLAFTWCAEALAASKKHRTREARTYYRYDAHRTRSNTVADNGLCQRDTGTPNSSLNFHNKCDVQEFWERQRRGGGGFR